MTNFIKTGVGNTVLLAALILITACGGGASSGEKTSLPTTALTVSSTSPADNAKGVAANATLTATFSGALDELSLADNFTLSAGATPVTGSAAYNANTHTVTFTPDSVLENFTEYTATITTGVKDAAGHTLISNYTWSFTTQTSINDTGITNMQCYQAGSDRLVACNSPKAIELSPTQDGMVGRDADAATNPDADADGKLGFRFSDVSVGAEHCVQDNVTGLLWEVKTSDGGLRDRDKTYTNLGDNSAGDASTFVTAVKASTLCGYDDWRLPTIDELQSIVDYSFGSSSPSLDAKWFPNTSNDLYWTSSPDVDQSTHAWIVEFHGGFLDIDLRARGNRVRLVR